jgi:hypothetical protein
MGVICDFAYTINDDEVTAILTFIQAEVEEKMVMEFMRFSIIQ